LVRAIERLATRDEVDLILPPWGAGSNLAIAPLMARFTGFDPLEAAIRGGNVAD